jgi:hypothetical protein
MKILLLWMAAVQQGCGGVRRRARPDRTEPQVEAVNVQLEVPVRAVRLVGRAARPITTENPIAC